jgi:hypothetical protein
LRPGQTYRQVTEFQFYVLDKPMLPGQ